MNCTTGEITSDLELIKAWREQGDRVLELPGAPQLPEQHETALDGAELAGIAREAGDLRTKRFLNNAALDALVGRRR